MTERRKLTVKLILSVFLAFLASMVFTWTLHSRLTERDARKLIDRTFTSVEEEITDVVDERLVRQALAAREAVAEPGADLSVDGLKALARRLRVTEIVVADAKGLTVASSETIYLARDGHPAFDFSTAEGQAHEMMRLINGLDPEYCQPFGPNSHSGALRKYVGVWRPEGGFVEIGCDEKAVRSLARSSIVDLFRNWDVGGAGGIVVTTADGLVLSDYDEPNREGTQWVDPDNSFYWERREVNAFPVYVMIPKDSAAVQRDVLVGATACLNGAALAFVALLVGFVIARFVRRQMQEQATKELAMATEIQTSTLPSVFPPFPSETRMDIFASMSTAKEVGGDFYDFYFTGTGKLLFLIADVSGKGVPAALFMMRAKTLIKGAAQTGKPLAQVFSEANDALCEGNTRCTFVTAWAGELNLETGVITYVNAGHNPPVVMRGGKPEYLSGAGSLVLGAMAGVPYKAHELTLQPGDSIYLYTDGISEQPNPQQEMFGEARLLEVIGKGAANQPALLANIETAVRAFADGTEQADDCTQLVLCYRGAAERIVEHTYKPTMDDLKRATADLEAALAEVPLKQQMTLMVAADEIFANIVRYSEAHDWTLRVEFAQYPKGVRLVFIDDGKPFDPLSKRDPDTTLSAEERTIGGMGILIVKKTMSPVTYSRKDGRNILMMGLSF